MCIFIIIFCLLPVTIGGTTSNISRGEEEIDLLGDLHGVIIKSLIKPIQVFIIDQLIEVDFNVSLGEISVSIYDETENVVYQKSVNTYSGMQIFIEISSFDEGVYTIEFVNSKNEYLAGEFRI